jgi:hypothetical protein
VKFPLKLAGVDSLSISPGWVADWYWCIRKDRLSNASLFASEETVKAAFPRVLRVTVKDSDESIAKVLPKVRKAFRGSGWVYVRDKVESALFVADDGTPVTVNRSLLGRLNVALDAIVYGDPEGPVMDEAGDPSVVMMPIHIDKVDLAALKGLREKAAA